MVFAPALLIIVIHGGMPLAISCAGLAALMHWEAMRLLLPKAPLTIVASSWCMAIIFFLLSLDVVPAHLHVLAVSTATVFAFVAALHSTGAWAQRIHAAGLALFIAGYSAGLIGLLARLRDRPTDGLLLALLALFAPWSADTGAYFAGRAFGRHKLAPHISPGKTIEGFVGGLFCATAMALVLRQIWPVVPILPMAAMGAVAGIFGTIGDLSESLLKRGAGAKDSSRLIPGHGGVLDRFDSVLFAAWAVYAFSMLCLPPAAQ